MAQLKFTVVKNFQANITVANNTSTLETNAFGSPTFNSNTFPRAAMIRVSLKSGTAGLTTPYEDDAEYFNSDDGFYVIGSNDLCLQEDFSAAGLDLAGINDTGHHSAFGTGSNFKGTVPSNNYTGPSYNNFGTLISGGQASNLFPLYKTEYDPYNGVTGSRLFTDIPAVIPQGTNSTKYKQWGTSQLNVCMANNPHLDKIKEIVMIDTIGRDGGPATANTKAFQGNKVLVFVIFKDGVSIDDDTTIEIPIAGRPRFVDSSYEYDNGLVGGVGSQYRKRINTRSKVNVKLKFKDDLDVEVNKVTNSVDVEEHVKSHSDIQNNLDNGLRVFNLSGMCLTNRVKKIAQVKITAPNDSYFISKPILKTKYNNLKFKLKDKTIDNTNGKVVTYYCYDLMYKAEQSTSKTNIVKATVTASTELLKTSFARLDAITGLEFGSNIIKENGETRDVKIYGKPGVNFKILVNESVPDTTTHGDLDYVDFSPANDTSILLAANSLAETAGGKMRCLQGAIPKSGVFAFKQVFPNNVINRNKIGSGKSSATNIDFSKSIANVKVGDRLYTKGINAGDRIDVVTLGTDTRISQLSGSITTTTGDQTQFKRQRHYNIQFDQDTEISNNMSRVVRLVQPETINVFLTNAAGSSYTITSNNGSSTSFSAGDDLTLKYSGTTSRSKFLPYTTNIGMSSFQNSKVKKVSMLLTLADAADRFTAVQTPVMNSKDQSKSDFTNSTYLENGGTTIKVFNFSHSAVNTSNTITLTYFFEIVRVGSRNITMTLDLDDILTIQDN